jgi:tRNA1(Val) A37 N6-methylase TrmN6
MYETNDSKESIVKVNENLSLIQKSSGLMFGTDALLLAAFVRRGTKATAVDLGAGTGIISMLCAVRGKFDKIYAVEIQPDYCDIIKRNIELNHFTDKIIPISADIREFNTEADVVFTNPPYMKTTSGMRNAADDKYIARHEVCGDINDFCKSAAMCLKFGGLFYVVYRPERMVDLFIAMRNNKIEPKRMISVYDDIRHEQCLILVEGKKGAMPSVFTPRPFFINESRDSLNRVVSEEMEYVYKNGEFNEWYRK